MNPKRALTKPESLTTGPFPRQLFDPIERGEDIAAIEGKSYVEYDEKEVSIARTGCIPITGR